MQDVRPCPPYAPTLKSSNTGHMLEKASKTLQKTSKILWDLGLISNRVFLEGFLCDAEDLIRRKILKAAILRRKLRRKGIGNLDIVAVGEGRVLVVEVKNKLEKRMVNEFIEERLPRFKKLFPEYARYRVEGGIGALVVKDDVGRYAEKAGLFVLTQAKDGGAALFNRKGFKPKEFA